MQAADDNSRNVARPEKKIHIMGLNEQFLNGDQGRRPGRTSLADEQHSLGDTSGMQEVSAVKPSDRYLGTGNRFLQRFDDIHLIEPPVPN